MHCKPELNPSTQEEQPLHFQALAYWECWQHPRYMQRPQGLVLLFSVVTPCYGTLHVLNSPLESPCCGQDSCLRSTSPGCSSTQHPRPWLLSIRSLWPYGFFPYGVCVLMAFFLQDRANSTTMSLGMLLPAQPPRTDISQCCYRSKPAKAAVGEHLSYKLIVACLLSFIPTRSALLRWDMASVLGTHKALLQFIPVFNTLE